MYITYFSDTAVRSLHFSNVRKIGGRFLEYLASVISDAKGLCYRETSNEYREDCCHDNIFYGSNIPRPSRHDEWQKGGAELSWLVLNHNDIVLMEGNLYGSPVNKASLANAIIQYLTDLGPKTTVLLFNNVNTEYGFNHTFNGRSLKYSVNVDPITTTAYRYVINEKVWQGGINTPQRRLSTVQAAYSLPAEPFELTKVISALLSLLTKLDFLTFPVADAAPTQKGGYYFPENQHERCFTERQIVKCEKVHKDKARKKQKVMNLVLKVGKINCFCPPPERISEFLAKALRPDFVGANGNKSQKEGYYYPENQSEVCLTIDYLSKCEKAHQAEEKKGKVFTVLRIDVGTNKCYCPPPERIAELKNFSLSSSFPYRGDEPQTQSVAKVLPELKLMYTTELTSIVNDHIHNGALEALSTSISVIPLQVTPITEMTRIVNDGYMPVGQIKYSKGISFTDSRTDSGTAELKPIDNLDISMLRDYDHIDRPYYGLTILRYLKKNEILNRDFYNKTFYPVLLLASDKLKKDREKFNEANLLRETVSVLIQLIHKFEHMPLVHALRVDPIYKKLMFLAQQINSLGNYAFTLTEDAQRLYTNKASEILNGVITLNELRELRIEALKLIDFYKNDIEESAVTVTAISPKLKSILSVVEELFKEVTILSGNKPEGKLIMDSLAATAYRLDRKVCQALKPASVHGCTLFPDIGVSVFKLKGTKYRRQYALLVAYQILIPRLIVIKYSAQVYTDTYELSLLAKLVCSLIKNEEYCAEGTLRQVINKGNELKVIKRYLDGSGKGELLQDASALLVAGVSSAGLLAILNGLISEMKKAELLQGVIDYGNPSSNLQETKDGLDFTKPLTPELEQLDPLYFPEIKSPEDEPNPILIYDRMDKVARTELKGKKFLIKQGLTKDISGEAPLYITETQLAVHSHFQQVMETVSSLRRKIDVAEATSDQDYAGYLRDYFKGALATHNDEILDRVISRFKQIVRKVDDFLKETVEQQYRNIFIISTEQTKQQSGQYSSLLTEEQRRDASYAVTFYNRKSSIGIIADTANSPNPMHPLHYREDERHSMWDTLAHEATHAAGTKDFMYLPRMANGKAPNAKVAYESIVNSLEDMGTQTDLEIAILDYIKQFNLPYPTSIAHFLYTHPSFLAWLLINNADTALIFIRDVARGVAFDAPPPL